MTRCRSERWRRQRDAARDARDAEVRGFAGGSAATTEPRGQAMRKWPRFLVVLSVRAYRVRRISIMVYESRGFTPFLSWGRYLSIAATDLDRGDVREKIVTPVAVATLDPPPDSPTAVEYRRQYVFDLNRRAVEICVRFLGVTTRQAVDVYATLFVQLNAGVRRRVHQEYFLREVPPCDQLHDLWSHFAIPDPPPTCQGSLTSK